MVIELKDLQYRYPGHNEPDVLDIPCWSVNKYEHVFLHGHSGTGKSTLLNIIAGVITGYKGNISVLGQNLKVLKPSQRDQFRANHIGYVFQQFNLIPYLNALDNLSLAAQFAHTKNKPILAHHEALLSALDVPQKDWQKPVAKLSVGQQQRIAIARAFVNSPQLIIADEPTSSLDSHNRDRFIQLLMQLAAEYKSTILFVSHDRSLASNFNRTENLSDINLVESSSDVF